MSDVFHVFFVFSDGRPIVAQRATLALLPYLSGHDVAAVACFLGDGPLVGVSRDDLGIETVLMTPERGSGAMKGRAARRVLEPVMRGARPHLVHCVGAAAQVLGGPVARRVGVRSVWSQFDFASLGSALHLRAALAPAAAVLAASGPIAARQRRVNLRRTRTETVSPGVRLPGAPQGAHHPSHARARARQELGLTPEEFAVGWFAGAETTVPLQAVASLCHARKRVRLLVIRDPAARPAAGGGRSLEAQASALGIADRLLPVPVVSGIGASAALDALDLALLIPDGRAPVALAPMEVFAAGVALVAGDRDPIREYVTPGHDAILVPADDHEALAAALLALADAPDHRARLAERGAATARERFGLDLAARRTVEIYRAVAGGAPAARHAPAPTRPA
jgi:hypothetical protein